MNWIGFEHWTLRLGNLELPVWILWFWAMFLIMLATGKTITGRGRVYVRTNEPIRYWFCSLFWGFMAFQTTFVWNMAFKGASR
jgi:hypothetical protein